MSYVTKEMRESFADHELTCEYEQGRFAVFQMARPDTRVMLVQVSFSPEGIAIQGDLTPERNGSVSVFGYDLNWFTKETPEGNLCEKFLTTKWVPSIAIAGLLDRDGPFQKANYKGDIDEITDSIAAGEFGADETHDVLTELNADWHDELPGYGYDPEEAGWLCIIHQTFRRLYRDGRTIPIGNEVKSC
jgi:hypothetical protein